MYHKNSWNFWYAKGLADLDLGFQIRKGGGLNPLWHKQAE